MHYVSHTACMGMMKINVYKILVRKSQMKRPLHRCENNIKMDLKEIRWAWACLIWLNTGTGDSLS
jgi:hypothetical protein